MRPRARLNEKTMAERAEGEGEKKCLHWLLFSSPIARYRAMRRKRPLSLPCPIAYHNYPKLGACLRATCYGELLRKKTKRGLQFSMNLGRVFVLYNPPIPKWDEEPLQSQLKKAGKSYHDLKCTCKKQQELQLSTNFAIIYCFYTWSRAFETFHNSDMGFNTSRISSVYINEKWYFRSRNLSRSHYKYV